MEAVRGTYKIRRFSLWIYRGNNVTDLEASYLGSKAVGFADIRLYRTEK
jgi:hypothetical protein